MKPLLVLGMLVSPYLHAAGDWRSSVYNWGSSLKAAAPSKEFVAQKTANFYKQAKDLTNYKGIIGVSAVILSALGVALWYKFSGGRRQKIEEIEMQEGFFTTRERQRRSEEEKKLQSLALNFKKSAEEFNEKMAKILDDFKQNASKTYDAMIQEIIKSTELNAEDLENEAGVKDLLTYTISRIGYPSRTEWKQFLLQFSQKKSAKDDLEGSGYLADMIGLIGDLEQAAQKKNKKEEEGPKLSQLKILQKEFNETMAKILDEFKEKASKSYGAMIQHIITSNELYAVILKEESTIKTFLTSIISKVSYRKRTEWWNFLQKFAEKIKKDDVIGSTYITKMVLLIFKLDEAIVKERARTIE